MNENEKEKRIEELRRKRAALKAPPVPEPGLIPVDIYENSVVVKHITESKIQIFLKPAEGEWKPIFDYLLARKKINEEIESILSTMPEYAGWELVPAEDVDEEDETTE